MQMYLCNEVIKMILYRVCEELSSTCKSCGDFAEICGILRELKVHAFSANRKKFPFLVFYSCSFRVWGYSPKSKPNSNTSSRSTSEDCSKTEGRWTPILGISSLNPRAVSKIYVLFCEDLYKFSEFLAYPSEAVELEARG